MPKDLVHMSLELYLYYYIRETLIVHIQLKVLFQTVLLSIVLFIPKHKVVEVIQSVLPIVASKHVHPFLQHYSNVTESAGRADSFVR